MKRVFVVCTWLLAAQCASAADEFLDRVDEWLTWSSSDNQLRARVSGLLDLEAYALPQPAPGVIDAHDSTLVTPRLSLFFDGQFGDAVYVFAQAREDQGFDPSTDPFRARLDEYALRWNVTKQGEFGLQFGKFATVVGSWTARHDSWNNPFITAPLPYENLTGLWDNEPARSGDQLLVWSHVRPGLPPSVVNQEKYWRLPIIWGPSYATGAAAAGVIGTFRYAFEIKNASLSSRPDAWSPRESRWDHPTLSGRVRYAPRQEWEFGLSASSGTYLRPLATPELAPSVDRGSYRETVLGGDASYAWHHWQLWAEVFAARFEIPRVGDADTIAYYIEARYKFTPELSGAIRWGEQTYGTLPTSNGPVRWGRNTSRLDIAPAWRISAHAQMKLQYSLQHGDQDSSHVTQFLAFQTTIRF